MNIYKFFQASVDALQKYILLHYDRETWFKQWVGLSDVGTYFKSCEGSLGSPYFHFDWASAGYWHMAKNWTLYRCPKCMVVGQARACSPCGCECTPLAEDEAYEFFRDHKYDIYEQELLDSLLEDGWAIFCHEVHPHTDDHKREALECLTAIAGDKDPMDPLVHLMWALKIPHHGGENMDAYSELDWALVDQVRKEGIQDVFGREEVDKFLAGKYPPIQIDLPKLQTL